jgi:hypothetical protein
MYRPSSYLSTPLYSKCTVAKLVRASVIVVLALVAFSVVAFPQTQSADARVEDNPVLSAFGLSAAGLPRVVYLLRSPLGIPDNAGLVVHAGKNGSYLVSGSTAAIEALRRAGHKLVEIDTSEPWKAIPPRTWSPVAAPNPLVQSMVDQVEWPELRSHIAMLEGFSTRFAYSPLANIAAESLFVYFTGLGLAAEKQPFNLQGDIGYNVVAIQPGVTYPDSVVVIGGHYDSVTNTDPMTRAPGADDNASGVSVVMTAARILSQYNFDYTIHYVCFGAEEGAGYGSLAYVAGFQGSDENIVGALVCDMLGYWTPGADYDLEVEANEPSRWLGEAVVNSAALYTEMPCELHITDIGYSDNYSFWKSGHAALNHESAWNWYAPDFNPFYHSTRDRLMYVDPGFTGSAAKVLVAALATLAGLNSTTPVEFQSLSAFEVANGVELKWRVAADEDIRGVNVYRGTGGGPWHRLNTKGLISPSESHYTDTTAGGGASYRYVVAAVKADGSEVRSREVLVQTRAYEVALHQNVPNPFNPTTTISFTLPAKTLVDLTVFDVNGAFVTTVVHGVRDEGLTEAVWKGTNERGNPVASGVYFYRLKAGKTEITRKMVLLR